MTRFTKHRSQRKKLGKFGNEPTVRDGIKFASKREANRYDELKLLERAGAITGLVLQPRYPIEIGGVEVRYPSTGRKGRQLVYIADFEYLNTETNEIVIEDAKGHRDRVYLIKKALMLAMGKEIIEI